MANILKQRNVYYLLGIILHVFLVLRIYPVTPILNDNLPLKGDLYKYFATLHAAANTDGAFGYDPFFMAGYPVGLWSSMGKKGFEILLPMFSFLSLSVYLYVIVVLLCLLAPLMVWLLLGSVTSNNRVKLILFTLSLLYWHFSAQLSYFWHFGNVFYPFTCCLLPVTVVFWDRIHSSNQQILYAIISGICLAIIFYFHTVLLITLVLPLFLSALLYRNTSAFIKYILASLVFIALAFYWLVPLLANLDILNARPQIWFPGTVKNFVMDFFSDRVYRHHFDRNFLYRSVVIMGVVGIYVGWRENRNKIYLSMGMGALVCLFITYVFTYLGPLAAIQPYRFITPATILLLFPASVALNRGIEIFYQCSKSVRYCLAILVLLMVPTVTGYVIDSFHGKARLGVSIEDRSTLDKLKKIPIRGRILCDSKSLGPLIPYHCAYPVIGVLGPEVFLKHNFTSMDDKELFSKKFSQWTAVEIRKYLDLYAIEYAVLEDMDFIQEIQRYKSPFQFYEISSPYVIFKITGVDTDMVYEGDAKVSANYGKIKVEDVNAGKLILKFHYEKWLRADNEVQLEPTYLLDDPVPFIQAIVPEGVSSFNIEKK